MLNDLPNNKKDKNEQDALDKKKIKEEDLAEENSKQEKKSKNQTNEEIKTENVESTEETDHNFLLEDESGIAKKTWRRFSGRIRQLIIAMILGQSRHREQSREKDEDIGSEKEEKHSKKNKSYKKERRRAYRRSRNVNIAMLRSLIHRRRINFIRRMRNLKILRRLISLYVINNPQIGTHNRNQNAAKRNADNQKINTIAAKNTNENLTQQNKITQNKTTSNPPPSEKKSENYIKSNTITVTQQQKQSNGELKATISPKLFDLQQRKITPYLIFNTASLFKNIQSSSLSFINMVQKVVVKFAETINTASTTLEGVRNNNESKNKTTSIENKTSIVVLQVTFKEGQLQTEKEKPKELEQGDGPKKSFFVDSLQKSKNDGSKSQIQK